MGVPQPWLRAYHRHGYRRITGMATDVPQARLRAYYDCGYRRTYGRTTLTFLLHIPYLEHAGNGVVHPELDKVEGIEQFPVATQKNEVHQFLTSSIAGSSPRLLP